jgi:hypothetical protein
MRALCVVAMLAGPALADVTVPRPAPAKADEELATRTPRAPDAARADRAANDTVFVVEGSAGVPLVATVVQSVDDVAPLDVLGFVDATLSSVEPRGGRTVIRLAPAPHHTKGRRP